MSAAPEHESRPPDVRVGSTPPGSLVVSVAERSLAADRFHWMAFTALLAVTVALDQTAKRVAAAQIELGDSLAWLGPLSFTHVRNAGIAFGFFARFTPLIGLITAVVLASLVVYFARAGATHPKAPLALGLIAGGSASNLVDRLRLGYVTDYLSVPHWPSFNLADCFIVAGVALVALTLARADVGRG